MKFADLISVMENTLPVEIVNDDNGATVFKGTFKEVLDNKLEFVYCDVNHVEQNYWGLIIIHLAKVPDFTYYVTFKIDGRFIIEVKANSAEEAKKLAETKYYSANFGELSDIDGEIIMVEDEDGHYLYEK